MIVIGLGFGDEGKGLVTSWLCSRLNNPFVLRFNGGHQAGHTVVYNGERHVFSNFGSGTLQDAPTVWTEHCTFDPIGAVREFGILKRPVELFVHPGCAVTTPFDKFFNKQAAAIKNHGTVGVGFGATLQRHQDNYKLHVIDLFYEKVLLQKLKSISEYYNLPFEVETFMAYVEQAKGIIKTEGLIEIKDTVFEGAQGVMLDQNFGFFPNVTRSNTTTQNIMQNPALSSRAKEVYYVTRTYQTRHGNGWMSNEDKKPILKNNENETNIENEYQGKFRIAELDVDLLNYALGCDNIFSFGLTKNLVITCMDQHEINVDQLLGKLNIKFNKVFVSYGPTLNDIKQFK